MGLNQNSNALDDMEKMINSRMNDKPMSKK